MADCIRHFTAPALDGILKGWLYHLTSHSYMIEITLLIQDCLFVREIPFIRR